MRFGMEGIISVVVANEDQRVAMVALARGEAKEELQWFCDVMGQSADLCYLILLRDNAVGFCIFRRSIAEVRRLFIFPKYRRRKIGFRAVDQLVALFRKDGLRFISLQISEVGVAEFLAKALSSQQIFTVEEGMLLVSLY